MTGEQNASQVPAVIRSKVKDSLAALKAIDAEAKAKLKSASPLDLTFTIEEVASAIKDAVAAARAMQGILQSLSNF